MPVLAATASDIGHGQLGLRSGLRTLDTLTGYSQGQKQAFLELRGSKVLTGWAVDAGSVYKVTINEVFNGRRLDVVAVSRLTETLTRVDARASVVAGTFYFDSAAITSSPLYVQLSDSSNPSSVDMLGIYGCAYYGTVPVAHPTLGDDMFVDGDVEIWTNPTTLTNWTAAGIGHSGASINKDSTVAISRTYSARLQATLIPGGLYQMRPTVDLVTVAGLTYRVSGYYRTNAAYPGLSAGIEYLDMTSGTLSITSDGRSIVTQSNLPILFSPAPNEWKRFAFDFIAIGASSRIRFGLYNGVAATAAVGTAYGEAWFDGLKLQRIYRYEYYEPRISMHDIPAGEDGRNDIFFGQWIVDQGQLSIVNRAGQMETLFGNYEWVNREIYARLGGKFRGDGNEILVEDMIVKRWVVQKVEVDDSRAQLQLNGGRNIFNTRLPIDTVSNAGGGDFPPNPAAFDIGRQRLFTFGAPSGLRPPRVDKSNLNFYGFYEITDPAFTVNATGDARVTKAWAYADEASADKGDSTRRVDVTSYVSTGGLGQVDVSHDIQLILVIKGVNDCIDFDRGGAALVATVAPGWYIPTTLATAVQTALSAQSANSTVTYGDEAATWRFTMSYAAGALNFRLTATAANRDRSLMPQLGYTGRADLTGALSYTGDTDLFDDCDSKHHFRVDVSKGYVDDVSGIYTGSASASITKGGDIIYFLLRKVLGVGVSLIDTAAVATVRSGAANLNVSLGGVFAGIAVDTALTFGQVVERIENSTGIELLLDGQTYTFAKRDNTTPSNVLDLWDRDFVAFIGWYNDVDIYSVVKVENGIDPTTGQMQAAQTTTALAQIRLGQPRPISFTTYCATADVTARVNEFVANTKVGRRNFQITIKGKLLRKKAGDKVRINRASFLGRTSSSTSVVCRIIRKKDHWDSWETEAQLVEVLTGTNQW